MFRILFIVALGASAGCGAGSVTVPGVVQRTYSGEWAGTSSQGARIKFSVSAENVVTSIAIGHDFNGCRDTDTFSGLSLVIGESALSGRVPMPSSPSFGFGSGSPEAPHFVQVSGQLTSSHAAQGTATFLNFEGCGNAVAHWNATKQ